MKASLTSQVRQSFVSVHTCVQNACFPKRKKYCVNLCHLNVPGCFVTNFQITTESVPLCFRGIVIGQLHPPQDLLLLSSADITCNTLSEVMEIRVTVAIAVVVLAVVSHTAYGKIWLPYSILCSNTPTVFISANMWTS